MTGRLVDEESTHDTINSRVQPTHEQDQRLLLIVMAGADVGQIFQLGEKPAYLIGRDERADILLTDGEISRRHAALRYDAERSCYLVTDLQSRNGTRLNGRSCLAEQPVHVGDKIQLGSQNVLRLSNAGEDEARYAQQMQQAVLRDALTGVFNRRYLDDRLIAELAFAKRHNAQLSVLLCDIDHFKRVNDTVGHLGGDSVLCQFAQLVQEKVRTEDVLARYGGEEFAVVCRDTDEGRATVLAERIRALVAQSAITSDASSIKATVSLGVAAYSPSRHDAPWQIIKDADDALYAAKHAGRDRVMRYSERPRESP